MKTETRLCTTHPYLQARWRTVGRRLAFNCTTRAEWQAWRRKTIRMLRKLTGYDTMLRVALKPRITEERDFGTYTRQRVEIHTEPRIVAPSYVLIPGKGQPPYPVVIAPHGHGGGGKVATAGCREDPQVNERIKRYNYDYGVKFAEAGAVTLCPEARGFGERREEGARTDPFQHCCQWINNMAIPLGQTVAGMWVWDLHRLIDYVQTRPDCDPDRIGCAGLSGGGLQTLFATALDTRIRCAVISGYFYGSKESLLDLYANCACNYIPHLWEYVDMGDIAALIAPRPLLIETGTQDHLNGASGLRNVRTQVRIARRAYRLLDASALLKHDIFEGGHRWHGVESIPWMQRHLTR